MLKRRIYSDLLEWKKRPHKCLLITGQRQVGKTFIVREFASNEYSHLAEFNFTSGEAWKAFEGERDVDSIIMRLRVMYPEIIFEPGRTLLFFDEIQDCAKAFSSLKQFTEDGRYDVIASGSLVGARIPKVKEQLSQSGDLVPMGYDEELRMYGLDFEEFLWAKGIPQSVIDGIRECIRKRIPMDEVIMERIGAYYREYMIVGGMPESVECFIEDGDFVRSRKVLSDLYSSCLRDINRYNSGVDIIRTTECFESIPDQLAETNKKYMYSRIRNQQSRQAADKYMDNLLWIKAAGYGNFCYGVNAPQLPLTEKKTVFKVYLSDTGMLVNMYGDNCIKAVYSHDTKYNCGAIVENAVAEALMKSGYTPRYYSEQKGDRRMELDFVMENGDGIMVVEVKSGKDRTAPSLNKAVKYYEIATRILFSDENIHVDEDNILHLPLFAACFLGELEPAWDGPRLR